jgi:hypothetical protein
MANFNDYWNQISNIGNVNTQPSSGMNLSRPLSPNVWKIPGPTSNKSPWKMNQTDTKSSNMLNITPSAGGSAEIPYRKSDTPDTVDLKNQQSMALEEMKKSLENIQKEYDAWKSSNQGNDGEVNAQWLVDKRAELQEQRPNTQSYSDFLKAAGYDQESIDKKNELQAQITDYKKQMADLETEKATTLANREAAAQGGATSSWVGESAMIERGYNSKIAALGGYAAWAQMEYNFLKGNLEDAQKMADAYMKYTTWDYEQNVKDLDYIKDVYKEMNDEEYRVWTKEHTLAQDELNNKVKLAYLEIAAKKANDTQSKTQIGTYIQQRARAGEGWATIAKELEDMNIPTYTGSVADQMLNIYFGGAEAKMNLIQSQNSIDAIFDAIGTIGLTTIPQ